MSLALLLSSVLLPAAHANKAAEVCEGNQGEVKGLVVTVDTEATHTEDFAWASTVVRAGTEIEVAVTTTKNPDRACNKLGFLLADATGTGETLELEATAWDDTTVSDDLFTQTWTVALPSDAPVGAWTLGYGEDDGDGLTALDSAADEVELFVLFNPWDVDGPVYYKGAKDDLLGAVTLKQQLSETETLTYEVDPGAEVVEEALLSALADLDLDERRDPAEVLAALRDGLGAGGLKVWGAWDEVTVPSDVLYSRWDGQSKEGKEPWSWTGSSQVFKAMRGGRSPAKYGQCFIFSSTLMTASRSIGVPTRTVSNFDSTHEHKATDQVVGTGYHPAGPGTLHVPMKTTAGGTNPRVWNYHVWTEVWTLPTGGGESSDFEWNAFDAIDAKGALEPLSVIEAGKGTGFTTRPLDKAPVYYLPKGVEYTKVQVTTPTGSVYLLAYPEG